MSPRATTKHSKSEAVFRALLDAFHDAVLVHDPKDGAILEANVRASELYGYAHPEFLALDLGKLCVGLSPCTREDLLHHMERTLTEGPQTFEWLAMERSGRLFWTEMSLRRIDLEGHTRILTSIHNITDRKRAEATQAANLRRSEAQAEVFLALAGVGADVQAALHLIAHHLAVQVGDLCVLDLIDGEGGLRTRALDQPYLDGGPLLPDLAALPPDLSETSAPVQAFRTGQSIRETDVKGSRIRALLRPELHAFTRRYNAQSLLTVPMRTDGQILGTITLVKGGASQPYGPEDQSMLQNLGDRVALSLSHAQLFAENLAQAEALRRINAELEQRVAERTTELAEANARLQRLAIEDALTGLANRRRFNEVMDEEVRRARRNGKALSLLFCDVDFFKRYNDCYGHAEGDACLRTVGDVLREVFRRAGEVPARYGGEEFAVILPDVESAQAHRAAEKLRQALKGRAIPHAQSDAAPYVTLSIGIATAPVTHALDASWFIARADEALYASKRNGRDRITCA